MRSQKPVSRRDFYTLQIEDIYRCYLDARIGDLDLSRMAGTRKCHRPDDRFFSKLGDRAKGRDGMAVLPAGSPSWQHAWIRVTAGETHKARCNMAIEMVNEEGHSDAETIARALMVLITAPVSQILIHRDAKYATRLGCARSC